MAGRAPATAYPFNPNGSEGGLTAVTTPDGRFTAMMPHPERVFRNAQASWTSGALEDESPWLRMFRNARVWVGWMAKLARCSRIASSITPGSKR